MSRLIHFEILADKPERAAKFYTSVFGWKIKKWGKIPYWLISTGPKKQAGIDGALVPRGKPFEKKGGFNAYVCTVEVKNLHTANKKILKAGGKEVNKGGLIHGIGWHQYFKDTEGNIFGALQPDTKSR